MKHRIAREYLTRMLSMYQRQLSLWKNFQAGERHIAGSEAIAQIDRLNSVIGQIKETLRVLDADEPVVEDDRPLAPVIHLPPRRDLP